MNFEMKPKVAVIGAGPAGIFASKELAQQNLSVFLINRDVKPGGLAEYGIYPDKHRMKDGLRKQFHSILDIPAIQYFGNLIVGEQDDISINDLRNLGMDAILVTVGAQGTKWLGLPGENLKGVFHAKDLVYHYNRLPPFSTRPYPIGKHVVIIGVGNVMMDIARHLIYDRQVETVTAIARRGPGEVKFTKKELEYIAANLDFADFVEQIEKSAELMQSLGQDPQESIQFIQDGMQNAVITSSPTKFRFRFLASPKCILGDENDQVIGLEMEENTLINENGYIKARGVGTRKVLPVDTVIFAIGDRVDPGFGLPIDRNEFVKNPTPRFPVDEISYEAYDPIKEQVIDDVFLAGWARKASEGLVGIARKDGVNAAHAIKAYLETKEIGGSITTDQAIKEIMSRKDFIVDKVSLKILSLEEQRIANERGMPSFKFSTNAEMLSIIKQIQS